MVTPHRGDFFVSPSPLFFPIKQQFNLICNLFVTFTLVYYPQSTSYCQELCTEN